MQTISLTIPTYMNEEFDKKCRKASKRIDGMNWSVG